MTSSLFAWQRAVISSDLDLVVVVTALRIGLDSSQASGRDVVINTPQVADDVGCSERTVWRRVQLLLSRGWLVQTARPTYGGSESKGRRARYGLLIPSGQQVTEHAGDPESDDIDAGPVAHDPPHVVRQPQPEGGTRPAESNANGPHTVAHDPPSRVPNQPQSSATPTAAVGTLSASDGSSNSSSSVGDWHIGVRPGDLGQDVSVKILATKLRQHTPLAGLRIDKLKPAQADAISALVTEHGDQRLVDQALLTLRRDNPPQTIQAFLATWQAMPAPGQRLALVKEPRCTEPGHTGTLRHCIQCSAEQKAGDRQ